MIYAMKFIRGENGSFETDAYDTESVSRWHDRIDAIIRKRQLIASDDWKAFGRELSGQDIDDFETGRYFEEYTSAAKENRDDTFLGRFTRGALEHKGMVINEIFKTGNLLAGFSKEAIMKNLEPSQEVGK